MKKKIIKIVSIILVITILVMPFFAYAEPLDGADNGDAESLEQAVKGDLKCPEGSTNCTVSEIDSNGSIIEIQVTEGSLVNSGDIQIVKTVRKTEEIGTYNVKFDVRGKNIDLGETKGEARVVFLLDSSATIKEDFYKVVNTVNKFVATMEANTNIKVAIVQFASKSKVVRDFNGKVNLAEIADDRQNAYGIITRTKERGKNEKDDDYYDSFYTIAENELYTASMLNLALEDAYELLSGVGSDVSKYVIVFGDGQYMWPKDTKVDAARKNLKKLKEDDVEFFAVRFNHDSSYRNVSEYIKNNTLYMQKCVLGSLSDMDGACQKVSNRKTDNMSYSQSLDRFYDATGDEPNYEAVFAELSRDVIDAIGESTVARKATLTDNLGDAFVSGTGTDKIQFDLFQIPYEGISTGWLPIVIDPFSETNWYDTNNGFTLKYTDTNGVERTFSSTSGTNPQAYWVSQSDQKEGCSTKVTKDPVSGDNLTENHGYYYKTCEEGGYIDQGTDGYLPGFTTEISINNFPISEENREERFDIEKGIGFPIVAKLSTNVRCKFEFDPYGYFMRDYNEAKRLYDSAVSELNRINREAPIYYAAWQTAVADIAKVPQIPVTTCTPVVEPPSSPDTDVSIDDIGGDVSGDVSGDVGNSDVSSGEASGDSSGISGETNKEICSTTYVDDTQAIAVARAAAAAAEKAYKDLIAPIDTLENQKKDAEGKINDLKSILENFIGLIGNNTMKKDLEDYQERFIEQKIEMIVDYSEPSGSEIVELVNTENINTNVTCEQTTDSVLGYNNVITKEVCYAKFEKEMTLPKSCLGMSSGEKEECSVSDEARKQINGGNKFYIDLDVLKHTAENNDAGEIKMSILGGGYFEGYDISLEKCFFTPSEIDLVYRQIDVSDPFLNTYDSTREIGRNFSNSTFNFTNIIKSNIWSGNPLYDFKMSKVNISKIKKDTKNAGINSYFGSDCAFSTLNDKYVCEFIKDENNVFFQN